LLSKSYTKLFLQVLKIEEHRKMESMFYSPTILLTPHNYLEWKQKKILQLRCRGLYQITMATKVEPDSSEEKNDFLNRQDMAIGCICMYVSPELFHEVYEESQESTPNELWTRLEILFGNKEDFMQEVEQIEPEEKPSKDQASYYEESSTKVFAQICIPLISNDVYSISYLFSESHVEDIWLTYQGSHADTFPCTMHAS
jgi:hypothetical protein